MAYKFVVLNDTIVFCFGLSSKVSTTGSYIGTVYAELTDSITKQTINLLATDFFLNFSTAFFSLMSFFLLYLCLPSSPFPSRFPSKIRYETKFNPPHACTILGQSHPHRLPSTNNVQLYRTKPSHSGSFKILCLLCNKN